MNKFIRRGKFYVYIVECRDGTYYTGYTKDLEKRVEEHNNSNRGAKYTKYKRPVRVVWSKGYRYYKKAVSMEHRIKTLTRKQKEMLVTGKRLDVVFSEEMSTFSLLPNRICSINIC